MKKRFFTRAISIVVPESLYQQLVELTQKTDESLCEWIRDAITIKLANLNSIVEKER
jgi:predicted DNA-binding protein